MCSVVAFILVSFLFSTFFTLTYQLIQLLSLIPFLGIVTLIYIVRQYIQIYFEIRSIKKLLKKTSLPVKCYCAFFAEGIYIQSIDMEDVFHWDDFMALGAVKRL